MHLSLVTFEPGLAHGLWRRLRKLLAVAIPLRGLTTVVIKDTHMHSECIKVSRMGDFSVEAFWLLHSYAFDFQSNGRHLLLVPTPRSCAKAWRRPSAASRRWCSRRRA